MRVQNVESTTRSARSREIRLQFEVIDPPQDYRTEMSVGNLGPSDLTEAAIRTALFGEPNPLGDKDLGFIAEIPDPFEPLRKARISDEIVRPLAELLIVDAIVGSGRAARMTEFNLGTAIRGVRRLKLSWESTGRYAGQRGDTRTIEGTVRL